MKTYKISAFSLMVMKLITILTLLLTTINAKASYDKEVYDVCSDVRDFAMQIAVYRRVSSYDEALSRLKGLNSNGLPYKMLKSVIDKAYKEKISNKTSELQYLDKAMLFSEQQYQDCLPKMQAELKQSQEQSQSKNITIHATCDCSVRDFSINTTNGVSTFSGTVDSIVNLYPPLGKSSVPSGNYSYSLKLGDKYCAGSFYLDNSKSHVTLGFLANNCKVASVTGY